MKIEEKWFSVRLLVESVHPGEGATERLFEDRIILVKSATLEMARQKAETFAKQSDVGYENPYGEKVIWRFKEILDAKELLDDTLFDGVEVYYAHISETEVEQLRRMLQPFQN